MSDVLTATTPGLHAKLLIAQGMVEDVEKDARNQHHGYDYAPADSVYSIGKRALQAAGLVIVNTKAIVDEVNYLIKCEWILMDSDSGESITLSYELPYVAGAGRPADKAVLASLTEIRGYMMIGLLGIERVSKLDVSGRDDNGHEPPPRRQSPQHRQNEPTNELAEEYERQSQSDLGNCRDCGAPNLMSQRGNPYCSAKCFLDKRKSREY